MSIAMALHVLAAVLWVGGMVFSQWALRPALAGHLEPARQPAFMAAVLGRFFVLVWGAVIVLPVTGFWRVFAVYGGLGGAGLHVHLMTGLGLLMILIFLWLFFRVYRPLQAALAARDMPLVKTLLGRARHLILVNTVLGLLVVAVAGGGVYGH